ncbi:hypothetical protein CR513_59750, partial [Mucuna pruriens]
MIENYKGYLQSCPHQDLRKPITIEFFLKGLNDPSLVSLDFTASGSFKNKPNDEGISILETITSNYTQWGCSGGSFSRKIAQGKYKVSKVNMLMTKFDMLSHKIDKVEKRKSNVMNVQSLSCDLCGMKGHTALDCQTMMSDDQENVAATHNFYD